MIPWTLTGTDAQVAIAREAFARIKFPFDRLTLLGSPELGWRDINHGGQWWASEGEALVGEVEGRRWIMGVFFPGSARILLDVGLEAYPELAMSVVGAEIAHAVDEFLPLTDAQREAIMALYHPDSHDDHSWWEKVDYSAEYFSLAGEAFMLSFVEAYSDIPFGNASDFMHGGNVDPAAIRRIIGIERTDGFVKFGKSKVYHRASHYPAKTGTVLSSLNGYRPCKTCKPNV